MRVVKHTNIDANYDGEKLNITGSDNNNLIYVSLDNNEIMKLLATPANSTPLEERLRKDFKVGPKETFYT